MNGSRDAVRVLLEDHGVPGLADKGQLAVDFFLSDVVIQFRRAHVKEIAQHRGRPGLPD